jgi:hypothetical protein
LGTQFLQGLFMNKIVTTVFLAMVFLTTGCASITYERATPLRFETFNEAGVEVKGMECKVANPHNASEVKTVNTPSTVLVDRSRADLEITCSKPGELEAKGTAVSRINAGMWGNLLFGGIVGAFVDHFVGKGYTYPEWMRLVAGKFLTFDRRHDKDGAPNLGTDVDGRPIAAKEEPKVGKSDNPGGSKPVSGNSASQSPGVHAPATAPVAVAQMAAPVIAARPVAARAPANGTPAKPDTSGSNPLNDAEKVPLSKEGRDEYRQWLTKPLPRAFAVAANGVWLAAWGTKPQNTALPSNPAERAMLACQNRAKEACKLYAVDNEVVWSVK